MSWILEAWGDYACFTRPEMKVERVSYDVITPSAARGIFDAILWHKGLKWHITKIEVLNPIKWASILRNELNKKTALKIEHNYFIEDDRAQRTSYFLRDVHYRLHAHFTVNKNELDSDSENPDAKFASMFQRRASKGQCYHRPYLGTREFACHFKLVNKGDSLKASISESKSLGWMLYDMDFSIDPPSPMFFNAEMELGVINTDIPRELLKQ